MKKIVIVNNNMKIGGVQKSLCNLLWSLHENYDITLVLFCPVGEYMDQLPSDVKVVACRGLCRYLGRSQGEFSGIDKLVRGGLVMLTRLLGRSRVMKLVLAGETKLPGRYDCAISFLHNGTGNHFYGGVQDYVLHRIRADRKIAFLHGDYGRCGADHPANNRQMARFHRVAACSEGCRDAFTAVLPELAERCVTVRNCHRIDQIRAMADTDAVVYDKAYRNVVMVSRLSREKGIERAIAAVSACIADGIAVRLHIVGDGIMGSGLEAEAVKQGIGDHVFFHGQQTNPYRYMKQADLFLMTSFHEAAPMVLEEARCVGLPVLTVETTSSHEMVTREQAGWVCDNTQEALTQQMKQILAHPEQIAALRKELAERSMNNDRAMEQIAALIEETYED